MKKTGLVTFSIAFFIGTIGFFTPCLSDLNAQSGYPVIDTTKLKAHYDFLGSFRDSTGNNVAAVPHNTEFAEDRFCHPQHAVQLTNTDSYLKVEDHPSLDITDTISISFWFYLDSIPETETRIISKSDPEEPDSGSYWISVHPDLIWGEMDGYPWSFSYTDSDGNIHTHLAEWGMGSGAWMSYTITFDGNSLVMYMGLEPVAMFTTESASILPNDQALWIGNSVGSGFTGKVDDILLYNRVLSGEELDRIHRQSILWPDMDRPTIGTCMGDSVELVSKAIGPFVQYRFMKDSQVIQDGPDSTCSVLIQTEEDLGVYKCVTYNCKEERRQYFEVEESYGTGDLMIVSQDRIKMQYARSRIISSISAEGTSEETSYQWYHNGNEYEVVETRLSDHILSIDNFSESDTGYYYCEITDGCNRIYSDSLHVIMIPPDSRPPVDTTALAAFYAFAGNFADSMGNTGPAVPSNVFIDSGMFTFPGNSASFSGPAGFLTIPDDPHLDVSGDFSLVLSLKVSSAPEKVEPLLAKSALGSDSLGNYGLYVDPGLHIIFAFTAVDGTVYECVSDQTLSPGTWHVITATYDGNEMVLFVDGRRKFTVPGIDIQLKEDNNPLIIGNEVSSGIKLQVDDLLIYRRALGWHEAAYFYGVNLPTGRVDEPYGFCVGDTADILAPVFGPYLSFIFSREGAILQEGSSPSLIMPILSEADFGVYHCSASNGFRTLELDLEVVSGKLYDDLAILTTPPRETYASAGEEVILQFGANHNYQGISYEMYHNGELLPGVGKRYTIDQVTEADTGAYYFVIVNGCERITSDTVLLIVEGLSYKEYKVAGWDWTGTISSAGSSYFSSICTGRDGSFYLLGHFRGGLKVEDMEVFSSLEDDVFVVQYSEAGELQWSRVIQSASYKGKGDLAVDSDGNVYVTGSYWNSIEIEDVTLSTNMVAGSGYMVKYNPKGEMLWIKDLETTRGVRCDNLEIDSLDQIYLGGNFSGSLKIDTVEVTGAWDQYANVMFIAQLDTSGSCQWISHAVTDPFMDMFGLIDMELSKSGEAVASGTITGPTDFGNGVTLSTAIEAPFLVKYNPEGVAQWGTSLASDFSFAETFDVSVDDLDRIFLTGMHLGEIAFGDFSTDPKGMVMEDIFLARFDSEGVCTALNSYGSLGEGGDFGVCYEPATDSTGYLLGLFGDTLVMNSDTLIASPVSGGGGPISPNMFIAKLNDDGEPLALKSAGVIGRQFFGEILVRDDGRLYFAGLNEGVSVKKGSSSESVAFVGYLEKGIQERTGPFELVFDQQTTICLGDSVQFRGNWYKESGTYNDTVNNPLGIDSIFKLQLATEICASREDFTDSDSYQIYPNPASQVLFVDSPDGVPFDLQVYGISGNLVFQRSDQNAYELDVQGLNVGLYLLKVSKGGSFCTFKVLIE